MTCILASNWFRIISRRAFLLEGSFKMRDVLYAGPNETLLGEIVTSILNRTEGKTLGEAGAPEGWGRGVDDPRCANVREKM